MQIIMGNKKKSHQQSGKQWDMTSNFYITKNTQKFWQADRKVLIYFFQNLNGNLLFLSECGIFNPKTKFTQQSQYKHTHKYQPPSSRTDSASCELWR